MTRRSSTAPSARTAAPRRCSASASSILDGDTYLRVDYAGAARPWEESGAAGLMVVLRNEGRWDTSNAALRRRPRRRL